MYDTYKMQEHICKELEKKSMNGIKSTADLDTVWKLIDAYKNLLKIDMLQEAEEYPHDGGYSQDGYSERRKRDSMGRYSKNDGMMHDGGSSYRRDYSRDGGYSEAKGDLIDARHSYRTSRSPESKRDVMEAAERVKEKFMDEVKELIANADTREEREIYKSMLHGLGSLA